MEDEDSFLSDGRGNHGDTERQDEQKIIQTTLDE